MRAADWAVSQVAALAELSTGSDKMSAFTMTTADRGEVTITGVNSLGGARRAFPRSRAII